MRKVLRMLSTADREQLNEDERAELAAQLLNTCRTAEAPIRRFLWALLASQAALLATEIEQPAGVQ